MRPAVVKSLSTGRTLAAGPRHWPRRLPRPPWPCRDACARARRCRLACLARAQMVDPRLAPSESRVSRSGCCSQRTACVVGQDPLAGVRAARRAGRRASALSSIWGERQTCTARTKRLCWSRTVQRLAALRSPVRTSLVVRRPECVGLIGADVRLAGGRAGASDGRATISPQRSRSDHRALGRNRPGPLCSSAQTACGSPPRMGVAIATRQR